MLAGKNGVIFGVANKRSIAFACAQAAAAEGARLVLTYQGERLREGVEQLAATLPHGAIAMACDVSTDAGIAEFFTALIKHMPEVDFAVHSIAFAPREELEGDYLATTRAGFLVAHDISCFSFTAIAQRLAPLMPRGGSLVTMTYLGGDKVVPHYNVMGLAKASLEASVRYLAAALGPQNIRVNAISAGPIRTLAASGIGDFQSMLEISRTRAPLRRNIEAAEVGDATVFLCSHRARGITGEVVHVDGGFHATAL
ncbi:MAG: enoyl-ACP reductase FabI [Planctomycetota bacterium]